MKKIFYFLAAAALVTLGACQKTETPDKEKEKEEENSGEDQKQEEVQEVLTLISDSVMNVEAESSIITISFKSTTNWTLKTDSEFIVLDKTSGEAGDNVSVKATVQNLAEEMTGRYGHITLNSKTKEEKITVFQGKVFEPSATSFSFDKKGGKAEFTIVTNVAEYEVKTYEEFEAWAPLTYDKATGVGSMAVAANGNYDKRTAYVKFTIPEIQVTHYDYDDDGNPVENGTEDYVVRVYVNQEGQSEVVFFEDLPAVFDVVNSDDPIHDATASVALFNGEILVCDAVKLYSYKDGNLEEVSYAVPEGFAVQSITNDDAGNLVMTSFMAYLGVGQVYAFKADDTKLENPVLVIPFVNDAWSGSRGADKVAVKGDIFGDAMVTMIYGGVASYGGLTYGLNWAVKGGKADVYAYNEWNNSTKQATGDWFTTPELADDIWLSNRAAFVPAGASLSDGFFYAGYDGLYNLNYYNGSEWVVVAEGLGDWANAPSGLATIDWNGKKILACVSMAYFPEWGMPSYLYIIDVTDPANASILSQTAYVYDGEHITGAQESSTCDVALAVEGDALTATVIDSSWGIIGKIKYPAL